MPHIPAHSRKEAEKAIHRLGFLFDRQEGSHRRYTHPVSRRSITLPRHNREINHNYVMDVLRGTGITAAEYLAALKADKRK